MICLSELEIGKICTIKTSFVTRNGFDADFVKSGKRPFVIAEITQYGSVWVVPSYSHCKEYSKEVKDFYHITYTPNGDEKYLNMRNMVAITCDDIESLFLPSNDTIQVMTGKELNTFKSKYRFNKKYILNNKEKAETLFKNPFRLDLQILKDYLSPIYSWLERDYSIILPERKFSKDDELNKFEYGKELYYNYLQILKCFIKDRDAYITKRQKFLTSQFDKTKVVVKYICLSRDGFISYTNPIQFSENYTDAILLLEEEYIRISSEIEIDVEPKNVQVPMLDDKTKKSVAKELIWLDHNIVSQKTYYDIYKSEPSKAEINTKIKEIEELE